MFETQRFIRLVIGFIIAVSASPLWAGEEPTGYRHSDYSAEVPDTIAGGVRIEDEAAFALWHTGVVAFVDVMPDRKRPKGLAKDAIWKGRTRDSVPGAIWAPDAGSGTLDTAAQTQFRVALERATDGNRGAPIVIFCRADCWKSWNAAKRAIEWGYTRVFWYASGSTGWTALGYPTQRLKPMQPQN